MVEYGIPEANIVNSRDGKFATKLLERTNGAGFDVVQCTMSGSNLRESLRCLAPFGRFIDLGRGDVHKKEKIELSCLTKCGNVISFDIQVLFNEKPKIGQK